MLSEPDSLFKLIHGSDLLGSSEELSDDLAARLALAFSRILAARLGTTSDSLKIAVGHDPRLSGPRLKDALIRGLKAADSDVLDCGLSTTPAMFLSCLMPEPRVHGAIMVTAGLRPAEMNGFKFITREGELNAPQIKKLLEAAAVTKLTDPLVTRFELQSVYMDRLRATVHDRLRDQSAKPLLGLRVVVDAGNGAGGFYARFLEDLGADVSGSRFLEPDGSFPNHVPDPEKTETLAALSEAVKESGADLGVLFDADCGRAAFADHSGRPLNGNRLIALICAILLEDHPGATFVTDSVTSSGLARFITEWGGSHYRFKRGYRNVIDEAIRLNAEGIDCPLAIETSGHAALRENHFLDDGMYLCTLLVCEAMRRKREGLTLISLIDELQEPVESVELRLPVLDPEYRAAGQTVIETILSHTLDNPAWELAPDNREGVRITFNLDGGVHNAWIMLRMSVHDPVMPLNAESDVPGGVGRMLQALYELLRDTEELDLMPLKRALQL